MIIVYKLSTDENKISVFIEYIGRYVRLAKIILFTRMYRLSTLLHWASNNENPDAWLLSLLLLHLNLQYYYTRFLCFYVEQ